MHGLVNYTNAHTLINARNIILSKSIFRSPNTSRYYSSPEQINPWNEESPPVPSTGELTYLK